MNNAKKYYKIMFNPNSREIIFDTVTETPIKTDSVAYAYLAENIDLSKWYDKYTLLYQEFLNGKSKIIFDLHAVKLMPRCVRRFEKLMRI